MALAHADGELTPRERVFLARFAAQRGLDSEALARATEEAAGTDGAAFEVPATPDERRELLGLLIDAAVVDKEVAAEEAAFLDRVGRRLGFGVDEVRTETARRLEAWLAETARRAATVPPLAPKRVFSWRLLFLTAGGCLVAFAVVAAVVLRWGWETFQSFWQDVQGH